jgi:hypothetical protein
MNGKTGANMFVVIERASEHEADAIKHRPGDVLVLSLVMSVSLS